jgi:hypothetical protein
MATEERSWWKSFWPGLGTFLMFGAALALCAFAVKTGERASRSAQNGQALAFSVASIVLLAWGLLKLRRARRQDGGGAWWLPEASLTSFILLIAPVMGLVGSKAKPLVKAGALAAGLALLGLSVTSALLTLAKRRARSPIAGGFLLLSGVGALWQCMRFIKLIDRADGLAIPGMALYLVSVLASAAMVTAFGLRQVLAENHGDRLDTVARHAFVVHLGTLGAAAVTYAFALLPSRIDELGHLTPILQPSGLALGLFAGLAAWHVARSARSGLSSGSAPGSSGSQPALPEA